MAHWKISFSDLDFGTKIGQGNFGAVYEGKYLGSPAAIKKLFFVDDEFMQKYIEREMETLTSLHHPNVVQLIGICIENNEVYIVTEFVTGGSLRKRLKNKEIVLDWPLKVHIAKNLALAMTYLHSKNIIHRDLKSHNLLVGELWKIKVCDFGLARKADAPKATGGNVAMTIVGTDDWMAPEVAQGQDYNSACDVFSYGMVLFEIITREKPPQREMLQKYAFVPEKVKPLIPKDTPPALWDLLCDTTKTDPKDRPTFRDVLKKLDEIEKQVGVPNLSAVGQIHTPAPAPAPAPTPTPAPTPAPAQVAAPAGKVETKKVVKKKKTGDKKKKDAKPKTDKTKKKESDKTKKKK